MDRAARLRWLVQAVEHMSAQIKKVQKDCADLGYPTGEADMAANAIETLREAVKGRTE